MQQYHRAKLDDHDTDPYDNDNDLATGRHTLD